MFRNMKTGMLPLSIAYLVIGLLLLIRPTMSLTVLCYLFGGVVLLTGILLLLRYLRIRGQGFSAPFTLVGGVIVTALGVFVFLSPASVVRILHVAFGLFITFDGLMRLTSAVTLAKKKSQRWWVLLLLSLLSIGLGVLLIVRPFQSAVNIVMLCGVLMILEGSLNLGCSIYTAMELTTLERLAQAAEVASLAAASEIADALDDAEAQADGTRPIIVAEVDSHEVETDDTDTFPD